MTIYYKALRLNRASWHDDSFIWPQRRIVTVEDADKNGACGKGLHLARSIDDAFRYAKFPSVVYEVEPLSEVLGEDESKIRVASARLLKRVHLPWLDKTNRFIRSIEQTKWFKRAQPPRKSWKMHKTWDAAGDAARAAARDAARDAARAAARDAARAAARDATWAAAGDAAGDATWAAARAAARAVARDAAWNAAGDAALIASVHLCCDLPLDQKYVKCAKARWEVWKRGYGLLCDVEGELYVYEQP